MQVEQGCLAGQVSGDRKDLRELEQTLAQAQIELGSLLALLTPVSYERHPS